MKKTTVVTLCSMLLIMLVLSTLNAAGQGSFNLYLPAVLKPGGQKTSSQLIDDAVQAGKINAETGLVYKLYAVYNDNALPGEFRGEPKRTDDLETITSVKQAYGSMSADNKAKVARFFQRPDTPNSWATQRIADFLSERANGVSPQVINTRPPLDGNWAVAQSVKGVKVHYNGSVADQKAKAEGIVAAIDGEIYTKLDEVMPHLWSSDLGCDQNGGDGDLDIYLVPAIGVFGVTPACLTDPASPSWIVLDGSEPLGDATHDGLIHTAAHELLHAAQWNYSYMGGFGEYYWLWEATAVWFQDYVYRDSKSEHMYAPSYLDTPFWPLENRGNDRHYGAYLYPFYLTRVEGFSPTLIGKWFANASKFTSLKTVDGAFATPGEFEDNWPEFVMYNLNVAPYDDYKTGDGMVHTAKKYEKIISGVANLKEFEFGGTAPDELGHMTAMYHHIKFTDDSARSVIFYNGVTYKLNKVNQVVGGVDTTAKFYKPEMLSYEAHKGISVQALIKINGEWTYEDWTSLGSRSFCRDAKAERIEEVVLVFANSNFDDTNPNYTYKWPGEGPTMVYSDVGCWRWSGTVTRNDPTTEGVAHTTNGNVTFERAFDEGVSPVQLYQVLEGNMNMAVNGTVKGSGDNRSYTLNGSASLTFGDGGSQTEIFTYNGILEAAALRAYWGRAVSGAEVLPCGKTSYDVEEGRETEDFCPTAGEFFRTQPGGTSAVKQFSNGGQMTGSYTTPGGVVYTWNLTAEREP